MSLDHASAQVPTSRDREGADSASARFSPLTNVRGSDHDRGSFGYLDWLVLLLLALAIYACRVDALSVRGEESRRIRITCEMLDRGNLFVQTEQGIVFTERPPLCNWLIALGILLTGSDSVVVARLFSVAATIGASLLVYAYCRALVSRTAALAAGASLLTMGQIMQLGGMAENEATLTFLLGGALLVWEWGYRRHWPALMTWGLSYSLCGLATLAKGLQGPVYFVGAVTLFLLVKRDRKFLLSRQHLAGITVLAAIVGLWQVPYLFEVGLEASIETWMHEVWKKTAIHDYGRYVRQLFVFPLKCWGAMLPWSVWLPLLASKKFRASLASEPRAAAEFFGCAAAVAFPTVWLAASGKVRYLMPLFPCSAVLVGIVLDRVWQAKSEAWLARAWAVSVRGVAGLATLLGVTAVVLVASPVILYPHLHDKPHLAVYAVVSLALVFVLRKSADSLAVSRRLCAVLATAAFFGLTCAVPYTDMLVAKSADAATAMREVKARLPEAAELVSLDPVHHLFQYHYKTPIRAIDRSEAAGDEFEYFCIDRIGATPLELGFAWEPVGEVCCDRNADTREAYVVVGRRIGAKKQATATVVTMFDLPTSEE